MRKPALIALIVFVSAAGTFAFMSDAESSAKSATIFTALSLLTPAVGITWTPLLTRRRRLALMAVLLGVASTVGMVAITRSTGPSDALSYPIFFGWTLAVLLAEGGGFLLVVGGLDRLLSRGGHHEPPPRPMK
jgi:tryptophan-rich sensory protein